MAVLLSRLSGLVREMVMARLFGAGLEYDSFILAFRIPNLTRDLFAEGALSSAFVPKFTEHLAGGDRAGAARLANLVATALILFVGAFCALGVWFSPAIIDLLAPGFRAVPGKFELTVELTRIMFPFLLLVALAAQAMGVLNACNQFAVPALSSTFFNLGSILFGLVLGFVFGPWLGLTPIAGMSWGVLIGGGLQLIVQLPSLARQGFTFRPQFDWADPGLRHILRLMGPAILGNAAVQINVIVSTSFAAGVLDPVRGHDGPVSWLSYAFRFMQLPLGLFGVALGSATLPAVAQAAAQGRMEDFRRTLARSLGMVFFFSIPSSVGLAVLGPAMIGAIYEGGSFDAYDTRQTGLALAGFAIGLAGYSAVKVLTPAFYALKDSRTPMLVSAASILVNYGSAVTLLRFARLGHEALALTTSAVALFSFVAQFWLMRRRLGGIEGRALRNSLLRIGLASLGMGLLVAGLSRALQRVVGGWRWAYPIELLVAIPAGVAVFYLLCRILRVAELEVAVHALAGPFARLVAKGRATIGTK